LKRKKPGNCRSPKLYRYGQGSIFSARILGQL
jgi:hypothetical protein